jgi:hypothetical protein
MVKTLPHLLHPVNRSSPHRPSSVQRLLARDDLFTLAAAPEDGDAFDTVSTGEQERVIGIIERRPGRKRSFVRSTCCSSPYSILLPDIVYVAFRNRRTTSLMYHHSCSVLSCRQQGHDERQTGSTLEKVMVVRNLGARITLLAIELS